MFVHTVLGDNIIIAHRTEEIWNVELRDMHTGLVTYCEWDDVELGAILALAIGDNGFPKETVDTLYKIAEGVCENLPANLRPIP